MQNFNLDTLIQEFKTLESVKAVVLSGSKTTNIEDDYSDYDIYVYSDEFVYLAFRNNLASKHSTRYEVNNNFWENGDEWVIESGKSIDIMYRSCRFAEDNIHWKLEKYHAQVGYTTCILFNIANSQILYDSDNWFANLQAKVKTEYPEELIKSIIDKNYPILHTNISSYRTQIKKAQTRKDFISVNHRITALLASYFDILFAINKQFHPGEKRLIQFVYKYCSIIPDNMEIDVNKILSAIYDDTLMTDIDHLLENLDKKLKQTGYLQ